MKITAQFLMLLFVTGILFSCKKGGDDTPPTAPAPAVAQVTTASGVLGGPKNTLITITGTNLPTNSSLITVTINGKACTVISASATSVVVQVPSSAGTGNIIFNFNGTIINGPIFNYEYSYGLVSINTGVVGYQDGPMASAQWEETSGLCVDTANNIYTSAWDKPVLRKISADLLTASTLAGDRTIGDVNGQGIAAKLGRADNISVDKAGTIYYADQSANKVKKIDKLGNVTTLISNASTPPNYGLVTAQVGSLGNIYVMAGTGRSIAKYNPAGVLQWIIRSHSFSSGNSTDGDSSVVKFDEIGFGNIAIENGETALYFTTTTYISGGQASQIKKLNLTTLNITTLAGLVTSTAPVDGPAASATFNTATGLALDATGGLYIADGYNNRIRYLKNAMVSTIIGAAGGGDVDGPAATAKIGYPDGLAITSKGELIIACVSNKKIKRLVID